MRLRTDDDIYRARLVYLGPPGYTLPVQLPYAQYGLFMLLVPLYVFIHYLFTFKVELFPAWEIALAIVTTSLVFRYVDPDRPAEFGSSHRAGTRPRTISSSGIAFSASAKRTIRAATNATASSLGGASWKMLRRTAASNPPPSDEADRNALSRPPSAPTIRPTCLLTT